MNNLFFNSNNDPIKFFSLGSGSSGNCYFLGNKKTSILIDAGIGIRTIIKVLKDYGSSIQNIKALLVTHDHADHIKTAGCLAHKYGKKIYSSSKILNRISTSKYTRCPLANNQVEIIEKEKTFSIDDLQITAFDVPHDSTENLGFRIEFDNQVFVLATDVGEITSTLEKYAAGVNHLVMESNYDEFMLKNGSYPQHLKERICSGTGHISNDYASSFIEKIYHEDLKNIWLCHISQDNNTPELAFSSTESKLIKKGAKIGETLRLEVLNRHRTSGFRELK